MAIGCHHDGHGLPSCGLLSRASWVRAVGGVWYMPAWLFIVYFLYFYFIYFYFFQPSFPARTVCLLDNITRKRFDQHLYLRKSYWKACRRSSPEETAQPQPHSRGMSQAKHNEKTCTTSTAYYVSVFSGGAWWCGVWSAVCGAGGGVAWEGVGRGGARRGGVR